MKKIWKSILSGIAVGCGFTIWVVWLIVKHKKHLAETKEIIQIDTPLSYTLASEVKKKEKDLNLKAKKLTAKIEKQTRQEVIDAFKEAFNVIPRSDD